MSNILSQKSFSHNFCFLIEVFMSQDFPIETLSCLPQSLLHIKVCFLQYNFFTHISSTQFLRSDISEFQ